MLLLLLLPLLLGCEREGLVLLFDTAVILSVRVTLVLRWRYSTTETQVLSPLCQAVVHSDLLSLGDVSDGDYNQSHLAATVDLSDATVRGRREGAGCRGWSRGCWGSRSCGRRGQRRGLS